MMKSCWRQRRKSCVLALVATGSVFCCLLTDAVRGELLYFQKGGAVQAPATIEGDHVVIEVGNCRYEFVRDDFRKIVPGFVPQREWEARRQEAQSAGFSARYEMVWWAITNGLGDEVAGELRALHAADPRHAPTVRMAATLEKLDRPLSDPELLEFRKVLGIETNLTRGAHVVLLHQLTEAEAVERVALLERVIRGFYLFFAAQGMELKVPDQRLVYAWFSSQKDYLSFLHSQGADAFATTRGYFHPTWNAVVAYDDLSSDRQQTAHEAARARHEELRQFQTIVDRLPPRSRLRVTLTGESSRTLDRTAALAVIDRLEREVRREELLLDLERRAINDGTVAHEIIHLLAIKSGLLPRHDAFPIWLQEGLAMQFEVIRGGLWAGISRASDPRLPDWRRIQPPSSLEPLVRDAGYGHGYRRDLYAQAWSLVYFLRIQKPTEFLRFLDLLRAPDDDLAEQPAGDRWLTAFRRVFGADLPAVERQWHQWMAKVQTPLERNASDPRRLPEPAAGSALNRTLFPEAQKNSRN